MSAKPAKDDESKLAKDKKAPLDDEDERDEDEDDEDSDEEDEEDEDEDSDGEEEEDSDEEDEDEDEEDEDSDEDEDKPDPTRGFGRGETEEPEDQYWWAPYAVLGVLILVGLLGFFGLFNKMFAPKTGAAAASASTGQAAIQKPPTGPGSAAGADEVRYGAKHILVAYKGSKRAAPEITRSKDEAKARAAEVVDKIKKGTKFDDLVKDYSDEPGAAARQGNLGRFRKGTMDPAFQAAVEKLKVDEASDVVESPFGFHVILRTF